MRHLFLTLLTLLSLMAQGAGVTPPSDAQITEYHLGAYSFRVGDNTGYTIRVARQDSRIYIQGLYKLLPEAWIEGTMRGNTAVFPSGQYLGTVDASKVDDSHTTFDVYFFCSTDLRTTRDLEIEYNPLNDTFEAYYQYILFSEKDDIAARFEHLQNLTFFSGRTELVTPPEDIDVLTYRLQGMECSLQKPLDYTIKVGFSSDHVYIKGISQEFPEAWIEGYYRDDKVIFMRNQYLGRYEKLTKPYDIWFTGIDHDEAYFTDIVFDYDTTTGTFSLPETYWIVINGDPAQWKWLNNFNKITLTPSLGGNLDGHHKLVTPPANVAPTTCQATANDYSFSATKPDAVQPYLLSIVRQGNEVWLQGLFPEMPEAWVYGTMEQNDLHIATSQYLGLWYGSIECWLMNQAATASVTFHYDAAAHTFTLDPAERLLLNDEYEAPSPMALQTLGNVVITLPATDGITLSAGPATSAARYDLQGRRLTGTAPRGLYIQGRQVRM